MPPVRYGPARIVTSGDEQRAAAHLPRALKLLRQVEERARLGGLSLLGSQWALDEDSYCYAVVAGGIAAVHVVAGYEHPPSTEPPATPVSVPDFVSGAVRGGYIEDVPATPDRPAHKRLEDFHPTRETQLAYQIGNGFRPTTRLTVEPWTAFDVLRNNNPSGVPVYSQYTKLKPTMYSGTMRKCVQALMGFGRQRRTADGKREVSLYDQWRAPRATRAGSVAPPSYAADVARTGLQIRYDWRFVRTHGLTRAADGRWWLVEIGINNGAIAMPLAFHAGTDTPAFRDWIDTRKLHGDKAHERANDGPLRTMLDELGGLPTGEAFPPGAEIEAWIRAGRVVRLLDKDQLAPFYAHSAYSSAMGWAFNEYGNEAHNTAWRAGEDGVLRGVHYAAQFTIGNSTEVTPARQAAQLAERLATLRKATQPPAGLEAAIWKCARLATDDVERAMRAKSAHEALLIVDSIMAPPLAPAMGTVRRMSEGALYNGARGGALIKFPEPLIGLLVSIDMRPPEGYEDKPIRCNTVVHVFFDGQALKWVRFFNDPRTAETRYTDTFEPCMYVGKWMSVREDGSVGIGAYLYSSDFDDRTETASSTTTSTITGEDLGYWTIYTSDDLIRPQYGAGLRDKRFLKKYEVVVETGKSVLTSVAVPFFDREAYYYAVFRSSVATSSTYSALDNLGDPWLCATWRNFPGRTGVWSEQHGWLRLDQHPDGCGPVIARTAMHDSPMYIPLHECADFADSGPWCFLCDNIDAMTYSLPPPPIPPYSENQTRMFSGDVYLVSSQSEVIKTSSPDAVGHWPLHSPMTDPDVSSDQFVSETKSVLGAAGIVGYDEDINAATKLIGAPQWPGMNDGSLTFIGVVDG